MLTPYLPNLPSTNSCLTLTSFLKASCKSSQPYTHHFSGWPYKILVIAATLQLICQHFLTQGS